MERVLVVDDDTHISKLLQSNLVAKGYKVWLCPSAKEAISAAKEHLPELVILDVMLGDGIGYEIARGIRRDPQLYRSSILFQSVIGEAFDVQHALRQGGDAYLKKPYTLTGLMEKINHLGHVHETIGSACPMTGMPRMAALQREVNHRLFREAEFALCLVFMKGLRVFRKEMGERAEQRIAELTARAIRSVVKNQGIYETFTAHTGGGYFIVLTGIDDYRRFREAVKDEFRRYERDLHAVGICDPPIKGGSDSSAERRTILKLLVGVTHTKRDRFMYADEMFEQLRRAEELTHRGDSQMRKKLNRGKGHDHWI